MENRDWQDSSYQIWRIMNKWFHNLNTTAPLTKTNPCQVQKSTLYSLNQMTHKKVSSIQYSHKLYSGLRQMNSKHASQCGTIWPFSSFLWFSQSIETRLKTANECISLVLACKMLELNFLWGTRLNICFRPRSELAHVFSFKPSKMCASLEQKTYISSRCFFFPPLFKWTNQSLCRSVYW